MRAHFLAAVAIVAAAFLPQLAGCGGGGVSVYPVNVRLSFPDGSTLEGAVVAFQSLPDANYNNGENAIGAVGKIGPDGTCRMSTYEAGDGAVAGKHRVSIAPPVPEREDIGVRRPQRRLIPARYGSFSTSGLEATVEPARSNEIVIEIDRT